MKQTKILLNLLFALLTLSMQANGQNFYPAMTMDVPFATPVSQCTSLNADMLEMPRFGGTIQAVAWSDKIGVQEKAMFKVGTASLGYVIDTMVKYSKNPDIVITDDYLVPIGYYYDVAVVYEQSGSVYLNTYRVWLTGSTPYLTPISAGIVSTPGNPASNPHIDMFSDNVNLVPWTNAPSMHRFVITWQENTGNVWDELRAVTGDMSNPAALTSIVFSPAITDISMPDVACYTDISTGDQYAAFVYVKHTGPSTTDYQTAVYSFTTTLPTFYTIEPNQTLGYPRIEAQSLYDPSSSNAAWMAVGSVRTGGLFETRMYDANNIGTPVSLSAPLANGLDNTLPAIAAGTGDVTTGGIGNMQYTAMLLPTTNPYAYSMPLQLSGGVFGWDYFEPNMTPLAPKLSPVIAITSCSNTGLNLMAAWFDGTDIMYKTTSNVNQYKTTSVSTVATEHASLSPNPATDELTLTGIHNGTYSITDVTGNVVAEGSAIDKTTINIQALVPGMYILDARKGSNSTKMKFVKQ